MATMQAEVVLAEGPSLRTQSTQLIYLVSREPKLSLRIGL